MSSKQQASWWIVIAFIIVPLVVSVVSTIHVVSFFQLSNYYALSLTLALAFEIGALSSLAGLVAMDKINKGTVWLIFILLTIFQMMGNTYYSYDTTSTKMISDSNLIKNFTELFGFSMEDASDIIFIKRIIAILSGAILPVISLSFLHLLVTYISKTELKEKKTILEEEFIDPLIPSIEETEQMEVKQSQSHENVNVETPPATSETIKKDSKNFLRIKNEPANTGTSFGEFLDEKKKKLEEDKLSYTELLDILFKNGETKKGDNLPSHDEFVNMIGDSRHNPNTIKIFLTLCNYKKITMVSGDQRKALVDLEEAKKILLDYLSLDVKK